MSYRAAWNAIGAAVALVEDPNDGPVIASLMLRLAARLYCRVGPSSEFVALAEGMAKLEHRYHGKPPTIDRSGDDPAAVAWLEGLGVQP